MFGDYTVCHILLRLSRLSIVWEGIVGLRHASVGTYGEGPRGTRILYLIRGRESNNFDFSLKFTDLRLKLPATL